MRMYKGNLQLLKNLCDSWRNDYSLSNETIVEIIEGFKYLSLWDYQSDCPDWSEINKYYLTEH